MSSRRRKRLVDETLPCFPNERLWEGRARIWVDGGRSLKGTCNEISANMAEMWVNNPVEFSSMSLY